MSKPRVQAPMKRQSRRPDGKRRRTIYAVALGLAIAVTAAVGVLVAVNGEDAPPPRSSTLPDSYADASPELIEAAQDVGFYARTSPGVGQIQDQPASAAQPPSNPNLLPVGSEAPAFTLETPTGNTVSLSDYRGKATLIEFFATWCPHCAAQAPHLVALANSMDDSRFGFVSVNANGEDAASVFAYEVHYGLPFPALLDPGPNPGSFNSPGSPGPVSTEYRVAAYPTFYIVDPEGKITWRSDGEQPTALLREELEQAGAGSP